MTPRTRYQIGNAILALAIVLLIVQILGMAGVIRKLASSRELNLVAIVLVIAAGGIRRRARAQMTSSPPQ